MAKQIEGVADRIITAAKREFLDKGYVEASLRTIAAAAHNAGCDSFISELENGYDTVVGGGGAHLSGGEKQRISITRAILKNAPIIILDEATANVDPETRINCKKQLKSLPATRPLL